LKKKKPKKSSSKIKTLTKMSVEAFTEKKLKGSDSYGCDKA